MNDLAESTSEKWIELWSLTDQLRGVDPDAFIDLTDAKVENDDGRISPLPGAAGQKPGDSVRGEALSYSKFQPDALRDLGLCG